MSLVVEIRHRQGDFHLEAEFESAGRLTALFGPSGSGKTTLVNLIGGLIRPDHGLIVAGGRVLTDTRKGILVPTYRRRIGYVFQDARLFPHLTVSQNLAYGRFFTPAAERYADVERVIALLGIGKLLSRKPGRLSGGERQRVAIGRALIASPLLMLMDEPLASLDDARKAEIMPYIERLRDETRIPIVYVSHSVAEVARLATDIVALADGRVRAAGAAADVLGRLDLGGGDDGDEAGALVMLTVVGHEPDYGLTVLRSSAGTWRVPQVAAPSGALMRARVRARDVMVATEAPRAISALNVLSGRVEEIRAAQGADVLIAIGCGDDRLLARVTRLSLARLDLAVGRPVFAIVKAVTFDAHNTVHPAPAPHPHLPR